MTIQKIQKSIKNAVKILVEHFWVKVFCLLCGFLIWYVVAYHFDENGPGAWPYPQKRSSMEK